MQRDTDTSRKAKEAILSGDESTISESFTNDIKILTRRNEELLALKVSYLKNHDMDDELSEWYWNEAADILFSEITDIEKELVSKKKALLIVMGIPIPKVEVPEGSVSDSDIATAKCVPLERLIHQKFIKTGNRLKTTCPFHKEKTPSFVVYVDNNTYHCFGCKESGDVIAYVQKTENVSFTDAVKVLLRL